jgi:hypothetical protein
MHGCNIHVNFDINLKWRSCLCGRLQRTDAFCLNFFSASRNQTFFWTKTTNENRFIGILQSAPTPQGSSEALPHSNADAASRAWRSPKQIRSRVNLIFPAKKLFFSRWN